MDEAMETNRRFEGGWERARQRSEMIAEIERLRGLLARLAYPEWRPGPYVLHESEDGSVLCFWCGYKSGHAADCAWVAARKEVGR